MKLTNSQICDRRAKVYLTARQRRGAVIRSVEELAAVALLKRSVFIDGCMGLLPAVVVMNMNTSIVHGAIVSGKVYHYVPIGR